MRTYPVIERQKFVRLVLSGDVTMVAACRQFGISRKTGYKVMEKHAEHGMAGLADGSRAPLTHPNQTPPEIEAAVLRVRKARPTWGSKKILWKLDRDRPDESWPARSTVDAILQRAGVVTKRGPRRRRQPTSAPVVEAREPNDVWSIDYKGWFRVGDGTRRDPLTINDASSRASLVCQAMVSPKSMDVRRRLEHAFAVFAASEPRGCPGGAFGQVHPVSPMCPVKSVTHVSGCKGAASLGRPSASQLRITTHLA